MQKRVFGHMRTANAQTSLYTCAQSDCPLTESLNTKECMNAEQMLG